MCNGMHLLSEWFFSRIGSIVKTYVWVFYTFQVRTNPSGALSSLVFMCKAIASWHVMMVLLLVFNKLYFVK
jgi:hypothetical protein